MISDAVQIAGITVLGTILVAIIGLFKKVSSVEEKVDGRLSELLELTRKSSKAEGIVEGKESKHAR